MAGFYASFPVWEIGSAGSWFDLENTVVGTEGIRGVGSAVALGMAGSDPAFVSRKEGSHGGPGGEHHRLVHAEVSEQLHFSARGGRIRPGRVHVCAGFPAEAVPAEYAGEGLRAGGSGLHLGSGEQGVLGWDLWGKTCRLGLGPV